MLNLLILQTAALNRRLRVRSHSSQCTPTGRILAATAFTLAFTASTHAAETSPAISSGDILAHTKVLASDEFEGRAPGSAGEEKTVAYVISEFKKLGLQPGNPDGSFVQSVPLVGITSHPTLTFDIGGKPFPMTPINDFVGPTSRGQTDIAVKASDVVFVGYGVVAPEFGWDDYKGVDVRGKTLVMLVNDPPVIDPKTGALDPAIFGGKAMTYYGRWSYKYEIAAQKGAAACLIVHETGPAAYPFAVIVGSRSRENFELRTPDKNAGHVAMEGWLTVDAAQRLFAATGHDFASLKKSAATREFKPVRLGAYASFDIHSELRDVDSKNVVAKFEGSDPKLRDEYVIYTAHWDHLGRDTRLTGDQIFNGAADNASGVAVLFEIAKAFSRLPTDQRPKRSVLFLSVTAEEKGLLGSRYYAQHPLYPLQKTVANINMDGANQFGRTNDVIILAPGSTTLESVARSVAEEQHRKIAPEDHPEFGSYYRSDHFEFAKVGVPALYTKAGRDYIGQPADFGERVIQEYIAKDYHKVSDEVRPDWTFEGAAQDAEFLFKIGLSVASGNQWPEWVPGSPFKATRDAMMAQPK